MDYTSFDSSGQRCWARDWLDAEHPIVAVAVTSLRPGDSPRLTAESKAEAQQMTEAVDVPPIVVHQATMTVIDGGRRVRAAQRRHQDTIAVVYFDGTPDEAFILAVAANTTHGLSLCPKDCKAAAARILGMYPGWSDRRIAAETGISHHTVAAVRRRCPTGHFAQLDTRLGKDGKARPLTAEAGRRKAAELIRADQSKSLRQVAKEAHVSKGTVQDVRAKLAKGIDPVVAKARAVSAPFALARAEALLKQMWNDPARRNDPSKAMLRALSHCAKLSLEAQAVIRAAPEYGSDAVADFAVAMADYWIGLAQQLRTRAHTS